jgi:hypothetical protein
MFLVVQFPFADVRRFLGSETNRLTVPGMERSSSVASDLSFDADVAVSTCGLGNASTAT